MELLVIDSKTLVSIKMSGASESVMAVCINETYFALEVAERPVGKLWCMNLFLRRSRHPFDTRIQQVDYRGSRNGNRRAGSLSCKRNTLRLAVLPSAVWTTACLNRCIVVTVFTGFVVEIADSRWNCSLLTRKHWFQSKCPVLRSLLWPFA
jgi:hypothetical protein